MCFGFHVLIFDRLVCSRLTFRGCDNLLFDKMFCKYQAIRFTCDHEIMISTLNIRLIYCLQKNTDHHPTFSVKRACFGDCKNQILKHPIFSSKNECKNHFLLINWLWHHIFSFKMNILINQLILWINLKYHVFDRYCRLVKRMFW